MADASALSTTNLTKDFTMDTDIVTYVVSHDELLHPDPTVTARLREVALSNCPNGCKIYADPLSAVRILAHNSNYGCHR